jgi:hypothetical protein
MLLISYNTMMINAVKCRSEMIALQLTNQDCKKDNLACAINDNSYKSGTYYYHVFQMKKIIMQSNQWCQSAVPSTHTEVKYIENFLTRIKHMTLFSLATTRATNTITTTSNSFINIICHIYTSFSYHR